MQLYQPLALVLPDLVKHKLSINLLSVHFCCSCNSRISWVVLNFVQVVFFALGGGSLRIKLILILDHHQMLLVILLLGQHRVVTKIYALVT